MRKQPFLFLLSILLLFGVSLPAQESVIVLKTLGKVEYLPDRQSQPARVIPGQELPSRGFIQFVEGGMTKLLIKGQPEVLDEGGVYDLESLLRAKGDRRQLNFISRFWKFVTEGVTSANDNKSLERYHEKYMSRSGGIRGWSEGAYGLAANVLIRDALAGPSVVFNWHPESGVSVYDLFIYRRPDDALVFKASTRDTAFALQLDRIHLDTSLTYYWMVAPQSDGPVFPTAASPPARRSAAFSFTYAPGELQAMLGFHVEDPAYSNASPEEQMLIEAYVLEEAGFLYAANGRYGRLLDAFPEDQLLRKLYAAFLARQGTLEKASSLLN